MIRWLLVTCLLAGIAPFASGEESKMPKVGETAPEFRLNDQEGKGVKLADLCSQGWVVLAFYPKANTPG